MTKISIYPEIAVPTVDDLLIGTDKESNDSTKNFKIGDIIELALPYKSYVCLLTQSGILDPVATVLYNNIGEVTWSRIQSGLYLASTDGLLVQDKTIALCQVSNSSTTYQTIKYNYIYYGDALQLGQYNFEGVAVDEFDRTMVEIRVYN